MRQPFWERFKLWLCGKFGHKPLEGGTVNGFKGVSGKYYDTCQRCRCLVAIPKPKNFE